MLGPFATASRFTLPFTRCRYCRTPPAHRCPRRRRRQRQRVTEGTAMAQWNGPNKTPVDSRLRPWCATHDDYSPVFVVLLAVMLVMFYRRLKCVRRAIAPLCKRWRHPQNRKYITYRNATTEGTSHGHGQHARKLGTFSHAVFQLCKRTDKHKTDKQTYYCVPIAFLCCFFSLFSWIASLLPFTVKKDEYITILRTVPEAK